jgi:alpha-ketoglutarate-dependent taurine dioxygenase
LLRHKLTAQHTKVQSAAKSIKEQLTGLGQQRQQQALDKAQQDKINKLMQDFQAILLVRSWIFVAAGQLVQPQQRLGIAFVVPPPPPPAR